MVAVLRIYFGTKKLKRNKQQRRCHKEEEFTTKVASLNKTELCSKLKQSYFRGSSATTGFGSCNGARATAPAFQVVSNGSSNLLVIFQQKCLRANQH
jgi:hypothetical protein